MIWGEYWDPFEYAERMRRRIKRMMRRIFREIIPEFRETMEIPNVDIIDKGDEILVRIDLPGVRKEDIDLRVYQDRIEIRARSKFAAEVEKENYYRRERRYTEFYRIISLPKNVDPESAKAKYEDGVLEVRIKKREVPGGRKVEID